MAYRDENGRVTIDEVAANRDVRNIEDAIKCLDDVLKSINNVMSYANDQKGKGMKATYNKANQLKKRIDLLKNELQGNRELILATVTKYKRIDAALKAEMQ